MEKTLKYVLIGLGVVAAGVGLFYLIRYVRRNLANNRAQAQAILSSLVLGNPGVVAARNSMILKGIRQSDILECEASFAKFVAAAKIAAGKPTSDSLAAAERLGKDVEKRLQDLAKVAMDCKCGPEFEAFANAMIGVGSTEFAAAKAAAPAAITAPAIVTPPPAPATPVNIVTPVTASAPVTVPAPVTPPATNPLIAAMRELAANPALAAEMVEAERAAKAAMQAAAGVGPEVPQAK